MPFFGSLFKKDGTKASKGKLNAAQAPTTVQQYPPWQESWERATVNATEIHELIHLATQEMKSRDLDAPFFLLPFRPESEVSTTTSARNFICHFFKARYENTAGYSGANLSHELLLTEPMVLVSIIKWCWSRLPGGVVTWETYELFRIGEQDSNMAVHAFDTFIPISVEDEARKKIIFDFFDLLAAVAARGKTNGLGGRKLSRLAGWWAFELSDGGKGFDGGYSSWSNAANACSHLFFAYLRSLSPEIQPGLSGISPLPRSLQALLSQTEYPPQAPTLMHSTTPKVVMIVDSVSPTPFALLRRTANFEYRDEDVALQQFSTYDDPVRALTDECRRVLEAISSTNQSDAQKTSDSTWSSFQRSGFGQASDSLDAKSANGSALPSSQEFSGLRTEPSSRSNDFGRPTTPSWADFLTTGFSEDTTTKTVGPVLLPPDKQLPPIGETARVRSSQSHVNNGYSTLEPGELASIGRFELDDTFWWVWITSLAGEETASRKAVFGRCALIEVEIHGARWLLVEEQIKGASPRPEKDAYIAEKKSKFSFRNRLGRRKSTGKNKLEPYKRGQSDTSMSKTSITPDQHTRIQQAAAQLAHDQKQKANPEGAQRRGRSDDQASNKTASVLTLQPNIMSEAAPAMKWAKEFDKDTVRAKYLSNKTAGTGKPVEQLAIAKDAKQDSLSNGRISPTTTDAAGAAFSSPSGGISRKEVSSNPPFPVTPTKADGAEIAHAASVPLPDEKAFVSPSQPDLRQHPALRSESPELSRPIPPPKNNAAAAAAAAWHRQQAQQVDTPSPAASPVAKKDSPKKLKKTNTSAGFKKMLGMGKKDKQEKEKEPAAAQMPTMQESSPAPEQDVPKEPVISPIPEPSHKSELETDPVATAPAIVSSSAAPQSAAVDAVANGPATSKKALNDFSQGPLEDVPAFIADDSADADSVDSPYQQGRHAEPATPAEEPQISPADNNKEPLSTAEDNQSEKSLDLHRKVSPSQDRWAQIRKNAAERAARVSEEQSFGKTDDGGETSGEETIEHRVARIKARVAELTGAATAESQGVKTGTK
ncbi:hypothetical protein EJ05DRAFT_504281 [Pseudovirgaria hyperparasitica]|uniref:Meiotically up-regulated protein Msb1/Mug8 domain-containing protein n=1 Tax=Pseudovirgaria hyperparasitica TaxID=470096 RepID=A0A6A6VU11_9PEZI|nr:uncharacterized protein EJ05DRAFT_504281 [Pseudovirgaria hyperparasitica]KAF2754178.1 hypothetical protein EJ05DRAFT_504281 [Pseudovirgaria hyperparasitica]